jgi:PPK2 family polyphosphate:nucleotide phosphotransferase
VFEAAPHRYLVPFDDSFRIAEAPTGPGPDAPSEKQSESALERCHKKLDRLQRRLFAQNRNAVLMVFQALDAAGKDSTIRAVLRPLNPAGCQVFSFKRPSEEELDHDFLWRAAVRLPERGRIGVFNRSHYEEVLVVRVHPELLIPQRLPSGWDPGAIWSERLASIRGFEEHLARNGMVVLKFFLNVSKDEQKRRFVARIDDPDKNWKFELGDVKERKYWDGYQVAYEEALRATSRPWAPWYAIPADDKPYMRVQVAEILHETLRRLDLEYPEPDEVGRARLAEVRRALEREP